MAWGIRIPLATILIVLVVACFRPASGAPVDDPKLGARPDASSAPTSQPATRPAPGDAEAEYRDAVRAARVAYCQALVAADEKLLDGCDALRKAAVKARNDAEVERLDRRSEAAAARLREDQAALAAARAHEPPRIVSASFGRGDKWADVTDRIRQLAASSQVVRANARTLGIDPDPGWRKRLEIVYLEDGERRTFMIDTDSEIRVPGLIPAEPAPQ